MGSNGTAIDLSTKYCGIKYPNPFVLASAPPTAYGSMIKRAFSLGWGGAVVKTLKPDDMEIVDVTPRFTTLKSSSGENVGFENMELVTKRPLSVWLKEIGEIKEEYPERVLIASMMADVRRESWQRLAKAAEEAGADALELNLSCPHGMPEKGIGAAVGQKPELTRMITSWVKDVARIPVIVKLTPNVTDIEPIAEAALEGGADGVAAINTVESMMGVDLDTLVPLPSVGGFSGYGGYSGSAVKPIGLRVVSQLAKTSLLPISGIGGISSWEHAVEYMLLGASNVQICTAVMLKGYGIINDLLKGLENYLVRKGFNSTKELIGLSLPRIIAHSDLDRSNPLKAEVKQEWCINCGLCVTVCQDAGYGAIAFSSNKTLVIDQEKCDGCSLCTHVCRRKALVMVANEC
ncbi:MAG: NAD-dependent dihydropyrimidine dehydrogenase subunit PreA [Desulfitobacteriaceae bacterium]|nr:NAD-dependent dihydropyrimidine dehydrogenase subunit PreA [Desulfitobacteriaceae bacterium]MDI6915388.1 NAD-dependent dihydropyrimidine dehydrogenase subunit PreA [Desulfitobacteriaceae bacterium]